MTGDTNQYQKMIGSVSRETLPLHIVSSVKYEYI